MTLGRRHALALGASAAAELGTMLRQDHARWAEVVRANSIRAEWALCGRLRCHQARPGAKQFFPQRA